MSNYEVEEPILNSPYEEPAEYWHIEEGKLPEKKAGRREAGYFYRDPKAPPSSGEHEARGRWESLTLVNLIREGIKKWRKDYPGVTRTTLELLKYWQRDGRQQRLFFAQIEAAETIIFLNEARADFLQGINIPIDEPSDDRKSNGYNAFMRYACKMATGSGKTTVMGMLAAWSILNKVNNRSDSRFSDVDLSATPYYLGRVGQDTNRTFPWVVSDFGLTDAIESGLVKIPQLAVRDTTGAEIPGYFNIWRWILPRLTPAERGGRKGVAKPEAILKWANTPIAMLAGLWEQKRLEWAEHYQDPRPPVFILVCKNTKIAKVVYEWLAEDMRPSDIPSAGIDGFQNRNGIVYTIRVDSKVVHETDTEGAKSDESRWMRFTLDTVGRLDWPKDRQGRAIYPEGFEDIADKLNRPLHPPGRDVRCIVSVGMLTEGWDCNTVTHIVGLRPFMSQLLCEQVVGRGLRRSSYEIGENGRLSEEVAKVFGVPFEVIPFKSNRAGVSPPPAKRYHITAVPGKSQYEITFPRVEGYQQAIRNRITVDWDNVATLRLDPMNIPPEVEMKAGIPNNQGRCSIAGPGKIETVDLNPYRSGRRFQELVFELARDLTRDYVSQPACIVPAHVLFPQITRIAEKYLREKVQPVYPANILDVFLSPYYGWVIERLIEAIKPDTSIGEAPEIPKYETNRGPGSTSEVDFWTSRDVREIIHSHLNYVVADTKKWEQAAAYIIDKHDKVDAFVKNAGLGFAIPYLHNGQSHDYIPDFIIRLKGEPSIHLILETKGFDELAEIKTQAAKRWVDAVNADGRYGIWRYTIVRKLDEIGKRLWEETE